MTRKKPSPGPRKGFTLVELWRSWRSSRFLPPCVTGAGPQPRVARRLKCVSNLTNWPGHSRCTGTTTMASVSLWGRLHQWRTALLVRLDGTGPRGPRVFDASQGVLFSYLQGRGVELCPAFNYGASQVKLKAAGGSYGYGYNLALAAAPLSPPVKASRLPDPAGTALLADAAQVNTWQPPASRSTPLREEWYYIDNNTNHPIPTSAMASAPTSCLPTATPLPRSSSPVRLTPASPASLSAGCARKFWTWSKSGRLTIP